MLQDEEGTFSDCSEMDSDTIVVHELFLHDLLVTASDPESYGVYLYVDMFALLHIASHVDWLLGVIPADYLISQSGS
jgi:hypothetical protein